MTVLLPIIRAEIEQSGPMLLSRYMSLCLGHPQHGYYRKRNPLGRFGDFITAPEISQVFGELIGLWAAQLWLDAGQPDAIVLAELGPGRGTLMADALRATRTVSGFHAALQVHFVETSPVLRAEQHLRVGQAIWHDGVATLPTDRPCIVIANEFFDALPIDQFDTVGNRRCITVSTAGELTWTFPYTDVVREACPDVESILADLAARLGALLVIDYGNPASTGDTFQAVKAHQPIDPLIEPGDCDLTAHVDFSALADAARGLNLAVHGPVTQGSFLRGLGLDMRTAALARANPAKAKDLIAAAERISDPSQMGQLFKVMAICNPGWPTPSGFR
jgi:NADH dehydrogenase [ubiquinone] 1 alpha subcomplex assembly factor 7